MNELTTEIRLVVPNENSEISAVQPNRDRQMSHPLPRFVVETPKSQFPVRTEYDKNIQTFAELNRVMVSSGFLTLGYGPPSAAWSCVGRGRI